MVVARILAPVHSLGPGERVCLWTQGCSKKCPKCISPEMQPFFDTEMEDYELTNLIIDTIKKTKCDGVTISGGDPFEQSDSLYRVLKGLRREVQDILVYTGYTLNEIKDGIALEDGINCLDYIDVLIDGRYVDEENQSDCVLRGSRNQDIIFLDSKFNPLSREKIEKKYKDYMKKGRMIETFNHNDTIILTGIMNR